MECICDGRMLDLHGPALWKQELGIVNVDGNDTNFTSCRKLCESKEF